MKPRHHVVVALGHSWGRAHMAHAIAMQLSTNGDRVTLLSNQTLAPQFSAAGVRTRMVRRDMGPLLGLYLDDVFAHDRPDALVLCDYPSNAAVLRRNGLETTALLREGIPVSALDVWDTELTGLEPDVFGGQRPQPAAAAWLEAPVRARKLRPVPILWPRTPGQGHFCYLPESARCARADRRSTLTRLGIAAHDKIVLFCTAKWQHRDYPSGAGRGMAALIPRLVADYVDAAGRDVHLVHVGPRPFDLGEPLGQRYHWVAPVSTAEFDALLTSADVLLSANIAASTVASAMVLEVPALILQNAVTASTVEEAEAAIGTRLSDRLRCRLADELPLYPFSLWPIGFRGFLSPVLRGNPYADALTVVEMLDEIGVASALSRLLRDAGARDEEIHRQSLYLKQIRSLPSVGELITAPTTRS